MSRGVDHSLLHRHPELRIVLVFALLVFLATMFVPEFTALRNFYAIVVQSSPIGCIAVGMTFVIMTAGVDLSVGSLVAMVAVLMAGTGNYPTLLMVILAMFWGVTAGAFNGMLISRAKLSPFIATLSTMAIAKGIALWYSGTQERAIADPAFAFLGNGTVQGVPVPLLIFFSVCLFGHILLTRTVFGKRVCAIGSNPKAAHYAGIDVAKTYFQTYLLTGALSGLAALIVASRLNTSTPTFGEFYELDAIAAVVIGGTMLTGGRGSVIGTFFGVLIFGLITNVLNLSGASPYVQRIAKGIVIIVAVVLQSGSWMTLLPAKIKQNGNAKKGASP